MVSFGTLSRVRDRKIVKAKPTRLIESLVEEKKVILKGNWLPSSKTIITLEDWLYMGIMKAKLLEIRQFLKGAGV